MKVHLKNAWKRYLELWQNLSGWRLFCFYGLHYTALFAVLWPLLFAAFAKGGKSFLWNYDAQLQWCLEMVHLSRNVRQAVSGFLHGEGWSFPVYSFARGMMENDLRIEPIQLLAILCPPDRMDGLYNTLVIVRFYLTGLSFSVLGFYFRQGPMPVLIGAVSYTFCQFALYAGVRHPFYMQALIYLPLLIVGIERTIRGGKPFLLAILVFLVLGSSAYWGYILGLVAAVYVFVRISFLLKENRFSTTVSILARLAAGVGVGALLSGAFFFAPLLQNLRAGRVGNEQIWQYTDFLRYNNPYYDQFISYYIVDGRGPGAWVHLGFSALAIPALTLLYVDRKKEHGVLRVMFLVLTVLLMFPVVGYVTSGFNATNNRWCFAYALCVSVVIMVEVPFLAEADGRTWAKIGIGSLAYFVICYFVIDHARYAEHGPVALAVVLMVLLLCRVIGKKLIVPVCLAVMCCSVFYTAHDLYDVDRNDYVSQFADDGTFYDVFSTSPYQSLATSDIEMENLANYRVSHNMETRMWSNSSFYYDIWGTTGYGEYYYPCYEEWVKELSLSQPDNMGNFLGLNGRSALLALDSVKYYVLRDSGSQVIPYGFRQAGQVQNGENADVILENTCALPLGYTYSSYLSRDTYETMDDLAKQEAQLQSAVLETVPVSADIPETEPVLTAVRVPVTVNQADGVTWENGVLTVTKEQATLELSFDGLANTETYLRVMDLDVTKERSTKYWNLRAAMGDISLSARFTPDAYLYSNGMKTQLLNFGYTSEGFTSCTLTFPVKGTYMLGDLQVWCQPMDNFAGQIEALRAEPLENVEINTRGLTGTVTVSTDKILCFSVPYGDGWEAYVDGAEAEILRVNTAFMGLELEAGNHEIELRYHVPGQKIGIALSLMGLLALAGMGMLYRRNKNVQRRRKTV